MRFAARQKGMTAIGWMLLIALILALALLAMKLAPIYIDGMSVSSAVSSLEEDAASFGKTPREIRRTLMKRLDINMVDQVTAEDIVITRTGNSVEVEVEYEQREHIVGNLDVVVTFSSSARIPLGQ